MTLQSAWRPIGSLILIGALAAAMFTGRCTDRRFEIVAGVVATAVLARSYDKRVQARTPGSQT